MQVQVLPAQDADMERIFEIAAIAFHGNEPIWDALYPSSWTPAGRRLGAERMRLAKNSDAHATWLKAVDESTGEIVGMAKWYVLDNVIPDASLVKGSEVHLWENEDDWVYFTKLIPFFLEQRNAAIARTQGNIVGLDILAIHPDYQRKKVGDTLVKWGTGKADALGVETIVESSICGRGLYEKNGFVFQEDCVVKVPGAIDRPTGGFAWLVRPRQAKVE